MKTNVIKKLMILSGLLVFSACPGKNDSNDAANVVGPQGRIMSLSSQNTYCDINSGTIKCTSYDAQTNASCGTSQKIYNQHDLGSFCQKMNELKQESTGGYSGNGYGYGQRCDASAAIDRILNDHCKGIATPGVPGQPQPGNPNPQPGYPNNPGGCQGQNYGCQPHQPPPTPIGYINCEVQVNDQAPLRFPLIAGDRIVSTTKYDIGKSLLSTLTLGLFGKKPTYEIFFRYTPKSYSSPEELIYAELVHNQKRRTALLKYQGNATQPVLVDVVDSGNRIYISCIDSRYAQNNAAPAAAKNLVCRGYSDTMANGRQDIDVNRPLNSINDGEELSISDAVRVKIDKSKSTITYLSSLDSQFGPDVSATSSLRSRSYLKASEGVPNKKRERLNDVDVVCRLK